MKRYKNEHITLILIILLMWGLAIWKHGAEKKPLPVKDTIDTDSWISDHSRIPER